MILFFSSITSSCSFLLKKSYGINDLTSFDKENYEDFLAFIPDTINYISIISSKEQFRSKIESGIDNNNKNDFGQPIQILYFNEDSLISFHANCHAKGSLRGLDWNINNRFESFVPISAVPIKHLDYTLNKTTYIYPEIKNKDKKYTIIFFWTNMMTKLSKEAFKIVMKNLSDNNIDKSQYSLYIVNTDYYFSTIK